MKHDELIEYIKVNYLKNIKNQDLQKIVDLLYEKITHYNWVGIYILKENMLHLGPWAGDQPTEHVTIPIGRGICGSAAKTGKIEIIPNVNADKRYLSCFRSTKSEIVIPIKFKNKIIGEIDIDSDLPNAFSKQDSQLLKNIADMLAPHIYMFKN
jgi:GAF domain-containing protein